MMISFLAHVCARADLIVSLIYRSALYAGMRMETRGSITRGERVLRGWELSLAISRMQSLIHPRQTVARNMFHYLSRCATGWIHWKILRPRRSRNKSKPHHSKKLTQRWKTRTSRDWLTIVNSRPLSPCSSGSRRSDQLSKDVDIGAACKGNKHLSKPADDSNS